MNQSDLTLFARTIMTRLPAEASETPSFRGFYAADNRVPDWEQRFAAIVASRPTISNVAVISDDWLIVAAVMSDRERMVEFLEAVQKLAPGQSGDPTLPCMLAVAG